MSNAVFITLLVIPVVLVAIGYIAVRLNEYSLQHHDERLHPGE